MHIIIIKREDKQTNCSINKKTKWSKNEETFLEKLFYFSSAAFGRFRKNLKVFDRDLETNSKF